MTDKNEQELMEESLAFWVTEMIQNVLDEYELKKEPDYGTLEACLEAYTKEKLIKLADENGWDVKRSWKKARIVNVMEEAILYSLTERFLVLGKESLVLLQEMAEGELASEDVGVQEFTFYATVYKPAVRMGLLYSVGYEDEVLTSMPLEVKDGLDVMLANYDQIKNDYQMEIDFWDQMEGVLKASVHLYGMASTSTIPDFWEMRHLKDSWEPLERMSFTRAITSIVPLLAIKNDYLIVDNYLIGSPVFKTTEDLAEFYSYVSRKINYDYYMPTKQEIEYYAKHSFERRSPVYKRLKQVVSKSAENVDMIMDVIESNIVMGEELSALMDEIALIGGLQFQTDKQLNRFVDLYVELFNNSRLWVNGGYTPNEVYSRIQEQEAHAGDKQQATVIPLASPPKSNHPSRPEAKEVKKVGRNDPCPCGSGKKYKNCCLKKDR